MSWNGSRNHDVSAEHQQSEPKGRILRFVPRPPVRKGKGRQLAAWRDLGDEKTDVGDLSEYERRDGGDDYPRRMFINAVAFAFILMLTLAGVWLAETMAMLQKNQDCALPGRRNCADLSADTRSR